MRICNIKGCNKKHEAKGYCHKHYLRFYRYGNPHTIKQENHGLRETPTYKTWAKMKEQCNNMNSPDYRYYGKRGIIVCDKWQKSFLAFYKDMGERPGNLEIDRIDNNGNYEPNNCRWVTHKENSRNRSNAVINLKIAEEINLFHKTGISNKEIAKRLSIKLHNVISVLYRNGWK